METKMCREPIGIVPMTPNISYMRSSAVCNMYLFEALGLRSWTNNHEIASCDLNRNYKSSKYINC